jgi:hypothetical protein
MSTKKKKKSQTWFRKQGVELAKTIAKQLALYRCEVTGCHRTRVGGFQIHGSHILNEGYHHRLSVEPENIMAQCAFHHMLWHGEPLKQAWFHEKWPGRLEKLENIDKKFAEDEPKPDYEKILSSLRKRLNALIDKN